MSTHDVLVLGGGTAGTAAARAASEAGASVVMFNEGELGGLCILRGCMPTKTMLHAAHAAHEARSSHTPGVATELKGIDFGAVMDNKNAKVARFKRAKVESIERGDYQLVDARAVFTGPDTVSAGGKTYRFTRGAVISTGSVARWPDIPGLADVPTLDSDGVMALRERPRSLIVLGSGAIGLELAQFFARMGTRVQLVSRRRVFERFEPALAIELEGAFEAEPNLELIQPFGVRSARPREEASGDGLVLTLEDGRELEAEALLLATGRSAHLDGLGLEAAGVTVDNGRIPTGPDMRTSNPRIFVAGDASGDRQLLHVANWEGAAAGRNAAGFADPLEVVEQRLHMEVIFTDPPAALLGLTESAARAAVQRVITASARFPETGRAITMDVGHGVVKLVADERGELLGAQILGPRADDLVHTLSAIMYYRGTARQMLEMPWYHPTLSEVLLSLARDIDVRVCEA